MTFVIVSANQDWATQEMVADAVLLAGCTSNGMSGIYLLSLRYNAPADSFTTAPGQVNTLIAHSIHNVSQTGNGTTLEVRAGYMGLCVGQVEQALDEVRVCSSSAKTLAKFISAETKTVTHGISSIETTPDPLNLIMVAEEFRQKIVFDGFIYLTIVVCLVAFVLLSTFPAWHEERDEDGSVVEVKPFPSRPVTQAIAIALVVGFGLGLVSILWQHINSSSTASMAETLTYGAVSGHVGAGAMALGWVAIGIIGVVGLGIVAMIMSISLIRLSTDDD
ncbi:hypothetical protein N7532_008095 [Penicillium argentinense]|uniref:Membrane fusion mating protein FIG1 n=1 Tax=Penicillium argentinense TaxID=1131581 RepID=A0A9W9EX05_9EURO|nr:uncharacterized protein N7532_008095 [Penicillium argentinense]KAJ5089411.1 hypothetical protein N7532_008095 [Penicillium argentinense]